METLLFVLLLSVIIFGSAYATYLKRKLNDRYGILRYNCKK